MISFIYWISRNFERTHGEKANVLYINRNHFEHLRQEFSNPGDLDSIMRLLGMTIMISQDAVHPHMARIAKAPSPATLPPRPATPRHTVLGCVKE